MIVRASEPMWRVISGLESCNTNVTGKRRSKRIQSVVGSTYGSSLPLFSCVLAADPAGDAVDCRAMKMPWVCVEPDPGGMPHFHMADHAFLVIGVNPPGMRVDQTDQRCIHHCLVADPQGEFVD